MTLENQGNTALDSETAEMAPRALATQRPWPQSMPKAPCICDTRQAGVDFTVLQIIECVGVICQNHSRVREGMAALPIFCWERCRQPFLAPGVNAHWPPSPELCDSFARLLPSLF